MKRFLIAAVICFNVGKVTGDCLRRVDRPLYRACARSMKLTVPPARFRDENQAYCCGYISMTEWFRHLERKGEQR